MTVALAARVLVGAGVGVSTNPTAPRQRRAPGPRRIDRRYDGLIPRSLRRRRLGDHRRALRGRRAHAQPRHLNCGGGFVRPDRGWGWVGGSHRFQSRSVKSRVVGGGPGCKRGGGHDRRRGEGDARLLNWSVKQNGDTPGAGAEAAGTWTSRADASGANLSGPAGVRAMSCAGAPMPSRARRATLSAPALRRPSLRRSIRLRAKHRAPPAIRAARCLILISSAEHGDFRGV